MGSPDLQSNPPGAFKRWFFQGQVEEGSGPFEKETTA